MKEHGSSVVRIENPVLLARVLCPSTIQVRQMAVWALACSYSCHSPHFTFLFPLLRSGETAMGFIKSLRSSNS